VLQTKLVEDMTTEIDFANPIIPLVVLHTDDAVVLSELGKPKVE